MARQEITLTHVLIDELTGAIEVGHTWNGQPSASIFIDEADLLARSADLVVSHDQASLWLRHYILALRGQSAAAMANEIGRTLVLDIRPAVAQTIALVEAS